MLRVLESKEEEDRRVDAIFNNGMDTRKLAIEPEEAEIVKLPALPLWRWAIRTNGGQERYRGAQRTRTDAALRSPVSPPDRAFHADAQHLCRRALFQPPRQPHAKAPHWVAIEAPRIVADDIFHAVQTQLNARRMSWSGSIN